MAIFNRQSSPILQNVTIVSDTVGMRNDNATPWLTDVTITVGTGSPAPGLQGIDSRNSGDVTPGAPGDAVPATAARVRMNNVAIRVSGGTGGVGLTNDQSHIELDNVRIEVSGAGQLRAIVGTMSRITMTDTMMMIEGGTMSQGIAATDSFVTVSQSDITVEHGRAAAELTGSQGFLTVNHSTLMNAGGSVVIKEGGAVPPALLAQAKLVGTIPPGLTCVNVYDGATYQPVVCP
jgi:hypothetical protein